MTGYAEIPATLSTVATGEFTARLSDDGKSLHYKLTYSGLEGTVTQAHVHFGDVRPAAASRSSSAVPPRPRPGGHAGLSDAGRHGRG